MFRELAMNIFRFFLITFMFLGKAEAVEISNSRDHYNLVPYAKYLEDPSQKLRFLEIYQKSDEFVPIEKEVASFGFSLSAFWFEIPINAKNASGKEWVLAVENSLLDYVDLYYRNADGQIIRKSGGDRRSFSKREIKHRFPYFLIPVNELKSDKIYLRVQTKGSAEIPITLMSSLKFASNDHEMQFGQGVFVGLTIILGLYYLIIGIGSRKLEYLLYSLFVFSLSAFKGTMNGVTMEYLWSQSTLITNFASTFTTPLVFFAAGLYTYFFLEMKNYKKWHYTFMGFLTVLGAASLFSFLLPYKLIKLYTLLGLIFDVVLIVASIFRYQMGFKPAKYFIFSWFAMIIASLIFGMQKFGILPVSFYTVYSVEIIAPFQALALAVGQTDKINQINLKIREAQKKALDAQIETNRVTELMKSKLEHLVAERTKDLFQKTQEIRVMMDSIKQGICTVDSEFLVSGEYSGHLEDIIGTTQLKNKSLAELILKHSNLSGDNVEKIKTTLFSIVGEDEINYEANLHVFPKELTIQKNGQKKILEFDWAAITDQEDSVEKVLVSIRDVTELNAAKAEAAKKEEELAKIGKILRLSASKFASFMSSAYSLINETRYSLNSSDPTANWSSVLRNIHTIKGNSRTYGLDEITEAVHQLEEFMFAIPRNQITQDVILRSLDGISNIVDKLNIYKDINDNTLERSDVNESENTLIEVTKFLRELSQAGHLKDFSHRRELVQLFDKLNYLANDSFKKAINPLIESLPSLANQLNKSCPEVVFEGGDFIISKECAEKYEDMFVHLVRNSMDHGFSQDKKGRIFIHVEQDENRRLIRYRDSGVGLDINKLREKAKSNDLAVDANDDLAVANLIFESGVSCSDKVTDISGRGVGMEAVKTFVSELGGQVEIELGPPLSEGHRAFSLIFRMPIPEILTMGSSLAISS